MLTQLEVFTPGITTPPLPIADGSPATDPIQIRNIDGLQPVKAAINTTKYGSIDGTFFNGAYTGERNIVITIGLNPDWATQTPEELRRILYGYFMPETQVTLRFTSTHLPVVQIDGYVESCEENLFSKDPEMQVSIVCPQPYFKAVTATAITGTTLAFTDATVVDHNYDGDIETGFVVDVTAISGNPAFTGEVRILRTNLVTQLLSVTGTVDSTHYLKVSTVQGDKFARQYPLPSGSPANLMGKVAVGSVWFPLKKGSNKLQIQSATPGQTWTLSYYAKYGGL